MDNVLNGNADTQRVQIRIRRSRKSAMIGDKEEIVLAYGEPFAEFQDQYKEKWYKRFMNPVRIKVGDGETSI